MINIEKELFVNQDLKYRDFSAKIINTVEYEKIIGVRTPIIKKIVKDVIKENDYFDFLNNLPHKYHEENQVHAGIIASIKDFDEVIGRLEQFLPYIETWATTDTIKPIVFKKNKDKAIKIIYKWLESEKTYTCRFGINMLMTYFLDEDFDKKHLDKVVEIESQEYYVNMMRAWYFATALVKYYQDTIKIIEEKRLDVWTHNKTIQKAIESYRISGEDKEYLRTFKIKEVK